MPTTLLDPHETNAHVAQDTTSWGAPVSSADPEVTFRHSGWQHHRTRIRTALELAGSSPRSLARFDLCGSEPWVAQTRDDPPRLCILTNTCRSRWCRPCANSKAHRITDNLNSRLSHHPHRLVTLTLKHRPGPLRPQLDRLYDCFRRLRRTRFWRSHVTGGAAVLEVTHAYRSRTWHPHLHLVCDGKYIPHGQLSDLWHQITADSFIVDVRYIRTAPQICRYVAKYLRKPVPTTIINKPDILVELIGALKHRRTLMTFGTWRLWPLTRSNSATVFEPVAPLLAVVERAHLGNTEAIQQLRNLELHYPQYLSAFLRHHQPQEHPP